MKKILTILVLAQALSCSMVIFQQGYYNTFYNAEKAFIEATKLSKDRADTTAPTDAEMALRDSTIMKCSKLVERKPHSGLIDDCLYMMGECYLKMNKTQLAMKKFEELQTLYPNSPYATEATIKYAEGLQTKGDIVGAINSLTEIIHKFPDNKLIPSARYTLAKIFYSQEEYDSALHYLNVEKTKKVNKALLFNIYSMRANLEEQLEKYNEATVTIAKHMKATSDLKTKSFLQREQARLYLLANESDKALKTLKPLSRSAIASAADSVKMLSAQAYLQKNKADTAIVILEQLLKEQKTNKDVAAYSSYLLAKTVEARSEYEKAKFHYEEVRKLASNPTAPFVVESISKSGSLAALIQLQKGDSDSVKIDLAEAKFKLAEINLLHLNQTQIAESLYLVVIDSFTDSRYYPKALLAYAYINKSYHDNQFAADSIYKLIKDLYPYSEYEIFARMQLDLPSIAPADSIKKYLKIWGPPKQENVDLFYTATEIPQKKDAPSSTGGPPPGYDRLIANPAADSLAKQFGNTDNLNQQDSVYIDPITGAATIIKPEVTDTSSDTTQSDTTNNVPADTTDTDTTTTKQDSSSVTEPDSTNKGD